LCRWWAGNNRQSPGSASHLIISQALHHIFALHCYRTNASILHLNSTITSYQLSAGTYDILTRFSQLTDCPRIATCRHTDLLRAYYWLINFLIIVLRLQRTTRARTRTVNTPACWHTRTMRPMQLTGVCVRPASSRPTQTSHTASVRCAQSLLLAVNKCAF